MKRSHKVALAALGVVGAAVWLSGGEEPPAEDQPKDAALYANVDDCVRANVLGRDTYEAEFRTAREKYLVDVPKFSEKSGCEASFGAGQCTQMQAGSSAVFVPAMVGFMVGNYLSRAKQSQALLPPRTASAPCPPGMTPEQQPGCIMARPANTSSSSSSSSHGGGAGWSSYSTSAGESVSRRSTGNGTTKVQGTATRSGTSHSASGTSRTSGSSHASSASTVSRGGFGSTAHSTSAHSSGG